MATTANAREVSIGCGGVTLGGGLCLPPNAIGLVIFAHGSGSSRHSPRNQFVAEILQRSGCATLLMDLLTERESADRGNVFDIPLLGSRVVEVTRWAMGHTVTAQLPIGFFGASTGAAAALVAAAEMGRQIRAVVSRGGRPDLAGDVLAHVTAPTLLLVGSLDHEVLRLNREAQSRMCCTCEIEIIAGASHLFEEPGTLELVSQHAARWFGTQFPKAGSGH